MWCLAEDISSLPAVFNVEVDFGVGVGCESDVLVSNKVFYVHHFANSTIIVTDRELKATLLQALMETCSLMIIVNVTFGYNSGRNEFALIPGEKRSHNLPQLAWNYSILSPAIPFDSHFCMILPSKKIICRVCIQPGKYRLGDICQCFIVACLPYLHCPSPPPPQSIFVYSCL